MRHAKIIIGGLLFLSFYIVFWLWFFSPSELPKQIAVIPKSQSAFGSADSNLVLGTKVEATPEPALPSNFKISIDSRRQYFNLSCEFAAASGIIFYFTNNPNFAIKNESIAEKELINRVWISNNPNVGIRMGMTGAESLDNLYVNLNNKFGGSDYYGIHAPPFIDLFANYKLIARPIYINNLTIPSLKKAISNGHLIMAWIKIGYASSIDDELSYGKIKIIRGEHAVIINGYDESGVEVMDPGIGLKRHVEYASLLNAASPFSMPFLEVSRDMGNDTSWNNLTIGFDALTEINRSIPKIAIKNGAGEVGAASQMREILKDFGYSVNSIENADNFDYQNVSIAVKSNFSDYLYILSRDIKIAGYRIASFSASLADDQKMDVIIVVGR
jgi:uncharacterized protein YvpB